jgi:hypothetical protein
MNKYNELKQIVFFLLDPTPLPNWEVGQNNDSMYGQFLKRLPNDIFVEQIQLKSNLSSFLELIINKSI